ncbi:MAG: lysylphosphatidylglycerol synthase transmembrane domain-containing protein, partial [Eubacteriales bacterium]|nr:lysylphosphatidylglycerol synthase transmembrane domain-containing protein [Eubacteriales bacterium]
IWFEGLAVLRIAKSLGINKRLGQGTVYGAADVYFSAITPSASGGQPASAYFMMRDGMAASTVTIILILNLMMYNLALLLVMVAAILIFGKMLFHLSIGVKILFGVGVIILIGLCLIFYMLLAKEKILFGIFDWLLRILERIRIVKNGDKWRKKLNRSMGNYKECSKIMSQDKRMLVESLLCNLMQRLSQLGVSFCIFMAFGKGLMTSVQSMAMQTFVAVGSNCIPIPGAMGVADYIMLDGFTGLVGAAEAPHMELLCRGIMFYGCVLTGGVLTLIGYVRRREKENAGVL